MTSSTGSSQPNPYDDDPDFIPEEQWLDHGLQALKDGDYLTALSYLSSVAQSQAGHAAGYRAQMGMVAAYERHGQPDQAILLCRQLIQSPSSKVRSWAEQTMASLVARYPDLVPPSSPEEPSPEASSPTPTGFMPLEEGISVKKKPSRSRRANPPVFRDATNSVRATAGSSLPQRAPMAPDSQAADQGQSDDREVTTTEFSATHGVPVSEPASEAPYQPIWKQAGRAKQWRPLAPVSPWYLWAIQGVTTIALVYAIYLAYVIGVQVLNFALRYIPFAEPFWRLYSLNPIPYIGISLVILLVLSPWLLDVILKLFYGLKPLPIAHLSARSPETTRLVTRFFRQRNLPVPPLGIVPTAAPLALAYGTLPQFSRIVVSQGLLDQLAEDEIAAIYATQLGHILQRDMILMSLIMLVLQIPYLVYWQTAKLATTLSDRSKTLRSRSKPLYYLTVVALYLALIASTTSYGLFRLLRWPALWFSRSRLAYSDRSSAESTGNPNGLIRALLKIAIGQAEEIQTQGQTLPILESLDLAMPLGYQASLTLGSVYAYTPVEQILKWDLVNPLRHWLVLNNSHPLTGLRLWRLATYARRWQLETELDLEVLGKPVLWKDLPLGDHLRNSLVLLLQAAPVSGLLLGLLMGALLWLIGGVAILVDFWQISWMFADPWLMLGCLPLGFSIGTFLRVNPFFQEINVAKLRSNAKTEQLSQLLASPTILPITFQPVLYQGKLLGRQGAANRLGQDLVLQTDRGLLRLHHASMAGPFGSTLFDQSRPESLVGQPVTVVGWFRRGATPWVDLDSLRTPQGRTCNSHHPIWSTILALLSAIAGSYLILLYAGRTL